MVHFQKLARTAAKGVAAAPAILAAAWALPYSARADFYLHHWENQRADYRDFRLELGAGYQLTRDNFDGNGQRLIPANFEKYSRIQADLLAAYGLTSRLSAFTRFGWARAQLDHSTLAGSTFGLTDGSFGLNFRAFERARKDQRASLAVDVQLQADVPFYSNADLVGPSLGDGTKDFTGGAFLTVPVPIGSSRELVFTGGAGYTYRTDDYSSAIPWSVQAALMPREDGFFASVAALGFESLRTDPRAALVASPSSTSFTTAAGGSFISGAINPSLFTLRGEAGYHFEGNLAVTAFAEQALLGQGAPNGFFGGLALKMRLTRSAHSGDPSRLTPKDYGRANQGFVNYTGEAHVTRVNDRLNLIKIDKGTQDGVEVGQIFDIFRVKKDGAVGEAIARGRVTSVQLSEAALTIEEYFREIWIDEGFLAKRPVE